MNSDGNNAHTVNLCMLEETLPNERRVSIGMNVDDPSDTSYWFYFENNGTVTPVRLSQDAFQSAVRLAKEIETVKANGWHAQKWQLLVRVVRQEPAEGTTEHS